MQFQPPWSSKIIILLTLHVGNCFNDQWATFSNVNRLHITCVIPDITLSVLRLTDLCISTLPHWFPGPLYPPRLLEFANQVSHGLHLHPRQSLWGFVHPQHLHPRCQVNTQVCRLHIGDLLLLRFLWGTVRKTYDKHERSARPQCEGIKVNQVTYLCATFTTAFVCAWTVGCPLWRTMMLGRVAYLGVLSRRSAVTTAGILILMVSSPPSISLTTLILSPSIVNSDAKVPCKIRRLNSDRALIYTGIKWTWGEGGRCHRDVSYQHAFLLNVTWLTKKNEWLDHEFTWQTYDKTKSVKPHSIIKSQPLTFKLNLHLRSTFRWTWMFPR